VINSIFDSMFNSAARIDMYRAWVVPEMDPEQPQPVLSNWSVEELEAYCGIYGKVSS
jgi:hypothetical protein